MSCINTNNIFHVNNVLFLYFVCKKPNKKEKKISTTHIMIKLDAQHFNINSGKLKYISWVFLIADTSNNNVSM